jgi:hypothetical protein
LTQLNVIKEVKDSWPNDSRAFHGSACISAIIDVEPMFTNKDLEVGTMYAVKHEA